MTVTNEIKVPTQRASRITLINAIRDYHVKMATRIRLHLSSSRSLLYVLHTSASMLTFICLYISATSPSTKADLPKDIINTVHVLAEHRNDTELFCTFFNNRAPKPEPNLRNCTWYKENSCCTQQEIDISFSQMKSFIGASDACQRYTNYLMCYICDPYQFTFYIWRRLSVCEEFCDAFLENCGNATLKGVKIHNLYKSGTEFCDGRRFEVKPRKSGECFYFDSTMEKSLAEEFKFGHLNVNTNGNPNNGASSLPDSKWIVSLLLLVCHLVWV